MMLQISRGLAMHAFSSRLLCRITTPSPVRASRLNKVVGLAVAKRHLYESHDVLRANPDLHERRGVAGET